jgi:muconolactone delta-isomerase
VQSLVLTLRNTAYTEADFAPGLPGELQRVRELYADGFIRQIWSRSDHPGSAILVEAGTDEELEERMNTLPLAKAGMVKIDAVIQLKPHASFTSS